jgi:signal transduction histidine kinase
MRLILIACRDGLEGPNLPPQGSPRRGTITAPHAGTLDVVVNQAAHAEPLVLRRRPRAILDGVIALAAYGGTIAVMAHGIGTAGKATHGLDALGLALAACASLPLFWWRRAPLAVFTGTTAVSALSNLLGYSAGPPVGPTIALYLLAESRDAARPWTRQTTATVVGMFCLHIAAFGVGHGQLPEVQVATGALVWAVAWFAGERTRLRREHVAELEQRAIRAERDALQERRLAVAEERARIARDLHDSAAHAINVIGVQAGAARLWQTADPERARVALETIEDVAHRTVAEIDHIVHSLREDGDDLDARPPQVELPPGLAALDSLLDQHRAAGHPVTIATAGTRRPLGGAAERALYRILQEALTNAARHGVGEAQVNLAFEEQALELTVSNAVPDDAPVRPGSNGGHGLIGMRERAALLGGELEASRVNRAFHVHARLPYGAEQ